MKSTVETKIIELVKLGHELAKELHCAESAALVRELTSQLEVQLVRSNALAAENFVLKQIIDSVTDLSNEPQYHAEGMGCGLEDRGITDRYDACRYGWDEAMERIYGEVIPCAEEIAFPETSAFLAEVRASALDEFAIAQDEQAKKYYELSPGCSGQNECQFAAGQAWYFAECIRKGAAQ